MTKILSLDFGERKVGVALGDETEGYVVAKPALERLSDTALAAAVAELVEREQVGRILVGLPLTLAGERSAQTERVAAFVATLQSAVAIPVTTADERLTTKEARAAGQTDDDDSAAAALLLETYLDARGRA